MSLPDKWLTPERLQRISRSLDLDPNWPLQLKVAFDIFQIGADEFWAMNILRYRERLKQYCEVFPVPGFQANGHVVALEYLDRWLERMATNE